MEQHPEGPLVCFYNSRSGGQQGNALATHLRNFIPEDHLFDLAKGGPEAGLTQFQQTFPYRILVAGGDGSVGWVLSYLDKLGYAPSRLPGIAVLPLGTGNDLARSLGWGGGYQEEPVGSILEAIAAARKVPFDRWKVRIDQKELIMNNYFSIGVDAKIALMFHEEREKNPNKFKSRTMNKMKYGLIGMKQSYKEVRTKLEISKLLVCELDGRPLELPSSAQALIVTNLPSYSGGANVWGKSEKDKFSRQSFNDGLFEVCTISGTAHMSRIVGKMSSADRVGQGRALTIRLLEALPAQIDGEPSLQQPCTVTITHNGQCNMFVSSTAKLATDKLPRGQSFASVGISELAAFRPLPHASWTVSNFQKFYAALPNPSWA